MIISERPDTDGVLAGILVYIVAMVFLFSVITALTTENADGTKTSWFSEDARIMH